MTHAFSFCTRRNCLFMKNVIRDIFRHFHLASDCIDIAVIDQIKFHWGLHHHRITFRNRIQLNLLTFVSPANSTVEISTSHFRGSLMPTSQSKEQKGTKNISEQNKSANVWIDLLPTSFKRFERFETVYKRIKTKLSTFGIHIHTAGPIWIKFCSAPSFHQPWTI